MVKIDYTLLKIVLYPYKEIRKTKSNRVNMQK